MRPQNLKGISALAGYPGLTVRKSAGKTTIVQVWLVGGLVGGLPKSCGGLGVRIGRDCVRYRRD